MKTVIERTTTVMAVTARGLGFLRKKITHKTTSSKRFNIIKDTNFSESELHGVQLNVIIRRTAVYLFSMFAPEKQKTLQQESRGK